MNWTWLRRVAVVCALGLALGFMGLAEAGRSGKSGSGKSGSCKSGSGKSGSCKSGSCKSGSGKSGSGKSGKCGKKKRKKKCRSGKSGSCKSGSGKSGSGKSGSCKSGSGKSGSGKSGCDRCECECDPNGEPTETCVDVATNPPTMEFNTKMGTAFEVTTNMSLDIGGLIQTLPVTAKVDPNGTPPRIDVTIDLGGGDTWTFGAVMSSVNAKVWSFTTGDSFSGTGAYANSTGTFTFQPPGAPPSFFATDGRLPDANNLEWRFQGTVCTPDEPEPCDCRCPPKSGKSGSCKSGSGKSGSCKSGSGKSGSVAKKDGGLRKVRQLQERQRQVRLRKVRQLQERQRQVRLRKVRQLQERQRQVGLRKVRQRHFFFLFFCKSGSGKSGSGKSGSGKSSCR